MESDLPAGRKVVRKSKVFSATASTITDDDMPCLDTLDSERVVIGLPGSYISKGSMGV
jgi:hypothetical protein